MTSYREGAQRPRHPGGIWHLYRSRSRLDRRTSGCVSRRRVSGDE
jgi:hypothetical protein